MKNRILKIIMTAGLLACSLSATAEDIDLFVGANPVEFSAPNVLFVVDNTANWNTAFENEMAALIATVNSLPQDKFRVGILFSAETGTGNNNTSGGYVRAAIRLMDAVNKPLYANLLGSFDKLNDKGNGGKSSLVMAEAYLYLSGGTPHAGNGKVKTDYAGNSNSSKTTAQDRAVYALAGNALDSIDATTYNKPDASGCRKTFIIYLSNGAPGDNTSVISEARTLLLAEAAKLGIANAAAAIPVSPSGSMDNLSDEWARFMKKSALAATTYTIDIDRKTTGDGPGWTALLKSMARVSKGKYFSVSSGNGGEDVAAALRSIFSEVQAVNSVFASVSLPVSVNTQGTYLNQMFIGMFRPGESALPRWAGNLKQYKMGYGSTGKLTTLDANGNDAINFETNFISECARSFWTPTAADTYWTFNPQGSCLVAGSDESNSPDGNIVEKGAQAYKLRSITSDNRNVKTCSSASCTELAAFSNSIPPASLGAVDDTERDTLIQWARGRDVDNEREIDPAPAYPNMKMRPSVHGDVVHSRPVAINFGAGDTTATAEVVVFYGGNDGMLRAVNGNRDGGKNIGGLAPGMELWSFMPPEFYPYIKRIYKNTTPISYMGMTEFEFPPRAQTVRHGRRSLRVQERRRNLDPFNPATRRPLGLRIRRDHPRESRAEMEAGLHQPDRRRHLHDRVHRHRPDLVHAQGTAGAGHHGSPADHGGRLRHLRGRGPQYLHHVDQGQQDLCPGCGQRKPAEDTGYRPCRGGRRVRGAGQDVRTGQDGLCGGPGRQRLSHQYRHRCACGLDHHQGRRVRRQRGKRPQVHVYAGCGV